MKYNPGKSYLVKAYGETYLSQGDLAEDEIRMTRKVQDILECERDAVQVMLLGFE